MNLQALAIILIRFMAFFYIIIAFDGLIMGLMIRIGNDPDVSRYNWQPAYDLFQLVLGLSLWVLAPKIAPRMQPDVLIEAGESPSTDRLVGVGILLLGLYWLIRSLPLALSSLIHNGGVSGGFLAVMATQEIMSVFLALVVMLIARRKLAAA